MKKIILSLGLLLALVSQAADVKISQLPLGTASSTGASDSFPYVATSTGVTKRLTLWDLINLPPIVSTYAPLASPTFTGTVTAPTFVGAFTGTVTNATHAATVATTTNASYFPLFVPSSTNGNQVFNLGVGLSFNPSTNNLSTTTFTGALVGNASTATALTGTLGVAGGGTGLASGTAGGLLGFTASTTAASMALGSSGQIVRSAGAAIPTWSSATYPSSGTAGGVMAFSGANTVVSSAAGSSGQLMQSAGTTTPGWTTATYPTTTTINRLLYSSSANVVADLATANTGVLVTSATGVPSVTSCTTANRVLRTDGTTLSCAQVNLNTDATGSISETNGGTGQSTYTTGDILYASAANTLSKLAKGTAGQALVQGASIPSWSYPGFTSQSAGYTATTSDQTIVFTSSATLALPAASTVTGKVYRVVSGGSSVITTIDPNSSETICGSTTIKLTGLESGDFVSDGTNWQGLNDACKFTGYVSVTSTCTSSPCTIASENGNWVGSTSLTRGGTGAYTITWQSGVFSTAPVCSCSSGDVSAGDKCNWGNGGITSSAAGVAYRNSGSTLIDGQFFVICTGLR